MGLLRFLARCSSIYLCAQAGWKGGWRAPLSGSEAVIVVDERLDLNGSMVFPDKDEFILWLEETYDDRE